MIGAIEFMKKWKDICEAMPDCGHCPLIDHCKGVMAPVTNVDILALISTVMRRQEEGKTHDHMRKH